MTDKMQPYEFGKSQVKVSGNAMRVRNLIADMMQSQVDEGTGMDTGGGFGHADLWLTVGGIEYFVSVKPTKGK